MTTHSTVLHTQELDYIMCTKCLFIFTKCQCIDTKCQCIYNTHSKHTQTHATWSWTNADMIWTLVQFQGFKLRQQHDLELVLNLYVIAAVSGEATDNACGHVTQLWHAVQCRPVMTGYADQLRNVCRYEMLCYIADYVYTYQLLNVTQCHAVMVCYVSVLTH